MRLNPVIMFSHPRDALVVNVCDVVQLNVIVVLIILGRAASTRERLLRTIQCRQAIANSSGASLQLLRSSGLFGHLRLEADLLAALRLFTTLAVLRLFLFLQVAKMSDLLLNRHVCNTLGLCGVGNGFHGNIEREQIIV